MTSRSGLRSRQIITALALAALIAATTAAAQSLSAVARPPATASTGTAKGLIWKVERDGREAFLVGSLHLLTPDFYPLPATMEQAFAKSDVLMEEIDMSGAGDAKVTGLILSKAMNPPGKTLTSQLSKETIAVLNTWTAASGLNVEALQAMKPWMVAVTVQTLALQSAGFDPAFGIDKHFQDAAMRTRKRLEPLETAMEQIDFLDGLSPKTQDLMLRESLKSASDQSEVKTMAAAWRAGDAVGMERIALSDMHEAPEVYETLLAGRNRRWIPKIESCIATSRCFIVVGAAHL